MDKKGNSGSNSKDFSGKYGNRAESSTDFSTSTRNRKGSAMDDKSNLWQSILNDVALRDDIKESHLIVLGDRSAGKRSLI